MRPSFDVYMMRIAYMAATRATCLRKHVGAVIVDYDHRIVSTGYNGAPRNLPSCDEIGCLLIEGHCTRTTHAESNCIDYAGRAAIGCTIFCTVTPCWDCAKRIVNAGINKVIYDEHYDSRYGLSTDVPAYLGAAGVEVHRLAEGTMDRFKRFMTMLDVPDDSTTGPTPKIAPDSCAAHRFDESNHCVVCGISLIAAHA